MTEILDLVSKPEIKWTKISISSRTLRLSEKSRSRLEEQDWRKQNLNLVSKVKIGISSPSHVACGTLEIETNWAEKVQD